MNIAVIGSGIGGISVACQLVAKGHDVTIYEKNPTPGGKMGQIYSKGYRFDTGPSLFTMPELVEELFSNLNEDIPQALNKSKLDVLCKYFFSSGEKLIAYSNIEKFKEECKNVLGEKPENIEKYLKKSSLIYKITADIFIFNSLHKVRNFLKFSVLKSLFQVNKIGVGQTMHEANRKLFASSKMVQLFDRYATYNGSNPFKAPSTLNVIAHLENNIGAFFPKNGMYSIIETMVDLAQRKGVKFHFNQRVSEILVEKNKAIGIKVSGLTKHFDKVIANTDVNYLANNMMKHPLERRLNRMEPSSSALVFYWGVKKSFKELDLHNILFSNDYKEEFNHLFSKKKIYEDPTVYIFVSSKVVSSDAPEGCENWFVMVNAPANTNQNWENIVSECRQNIVKKINKTLKVNIEDYIDFEKVASPVTIQNNTLSQGGALYGTSSNSKFAAFLRHPNFLRKIKNMYFVGGSVHPGGGIPLCLASAKIVSNEIKAVS